MLRPMTFCLCWIIGWTFQNFLSDKIKNGSADYKKLVWLVSWVVNCFSFFLLYIFTSKMYLKIHSFLRRLRYTKEKQNKKKTPVKTKSKEINKIVLYSNLTFQKDISIDRECEINTNRKNRISEPSSNTDWYNFTFRKSINLSNP